MGYTTNFVGSFQLDKQLTLDDYRYLQAFNKEDHRDKDYSPEYGYYCQWIPTEDGRGLCWDDREKFYNYVEWLQYLIVNFFIPTGYTISGEVTYQGEDTGDCGVIKIENHKVIQVKYTPQDSSIEGLVRKGIEESEDEPDKARWYLEEIAKKLGIEPL